MLMQTAQQLAQRDVTNALRANGADLAFGNGGFRNGEGREAGWSRERSRREGL